MKIKINRKDLEKKVQYGQRILRWGFLF